MRVDLHGFDALKAVVRAPEVTPATPTAQKLRERAIELATSEKLGQGSYAFRVVPIDAEVEGTLHVDNEELFAPRLVPESGKLTALGVGFVTLGPALESRVRELFEQRKSALALALDRLGSELLFACSSRLEMRLRVAARRNNLTVSGELRPGDPGLALAAQQKLMRLMAPDTLGIELHHGHLLRPLKSATMIFGVGIGLPQAQWSRCDHCPSRVKCARAEHRAASCATKAELRAAS